jgi:pimeloyl-ACP methyl ester carboxylesterase
MVNRGARAIIRPDRASYDLYKIPVDNVIPNFGSIRRTSVTFQNSARDTLHGSFYHAPDSSRRACVVYCHGNSSNQLEGRFLVPNFAPVGISVFCFDFSGCGCSTGKYVSLGHHEAEDLAVVLEILRRDFGIARVALWGRSMGAAVSAVALQNEQLAVVGAVMDSAFASLPGLIMQLVRSHHFPKWLAKKAVKKLRKKVLRKASFDICDVEPIQRFRGCHKPVFFICGERDNFVSPVNSQMLFDASAAVNKRIETVPGKHNTDRPTAVILSATEFLCGLLGVRVSFVRPSAPPEAAHDAASE